MALAQIEQLEVEGLGVVQMMMTAEDYRQLLVVVVVVMIASVVVSAVAVEALQLPRDDELLGETKNCSLKLRQQKKDLTLVRVQKTMLV